jgi:hypothetical protein
VNALSFFMTAPLVDSGTVVSRLQPERFWPAPMNKNKKHGSKKGRLDRNSNWLSSLVYGPCKNRRYCICWITDKEAVRQALDSGSCML